MASQTWVDEAIESGWMEPEEAVKLEKALAASEAELKIEKQTGLLTERAYRDMDKKLTRINALLVQNSELMVELQYRLPKAVEALNKLFSEIQNA